MPIVGKLYITLEQQDISYILVTECINKLSERRLFGRAKLHILLHVLQTA